MTASGPPSTVPMLLSELWKKTVSPGLTPTERRARVLPRVEPQCSDNLARLRGPLKCALMGRAREPWADIRLPAAIHYA